MTAPMPDPLAIEVHVAGRTLTIVLQGELDIATSDRLFGVLTACASMDPERLEIDVAGLEFIDSWGARAIVRAHRDIDPTCVFRVRSVGRLAALVFDLVGLDPGTFESPTPRRGEP